ncbi:MAG TPA: hypothetical protein VK540_05360 [Polyangiaceae bacterium]|nr:hypothetical protein [Polyangiaceae bacterium]
MKKVIVALAVLTGSGLAFAGCSQNTSAVLVKSLERSGRAAFLCIESPTAPNPGQQLDACFTPGVRPGLFDYTVPHVIALVTQTARGEIAVVDVTAQNVVDTDRSIPGYNFLPVGAMPTDIVATPGGNASFVGIGDPTRPGIFAIPSSSLPLWVDSKPPTFASWPACALPPGGVPTEILIAPDTTASTSDRGGRRAHCDGSPASPPPPPATDPSPATDLSAEIEMFGRLKLVVMLPELGEVDIIDAQDLLSRPPGSFDPCTVERRVFLTAEETPSTPTAEAGVGDATAADVSTPGDAAVSDGGDASSPDAGQSDDASADVEADGGGPDAGSDGRICSGRVPRPVPPILKPHPYALALADDGRLFVSDDSASVIHVVDMQDPCSAEEKAPLLPFSVADPLRAVISGAIAVSPLTSEGKRFVYAADVKNNGSLMVFDVSSTSTVRTPLLREDRRFNPFEPPDRIALAAPVESMTFITHEVPRSLPDPVTGVIPRGVPCDPSNVDDPNRPADDFVSAGASPRRLRGTFGFVALANGEMTVIDLDDFDANCRRPRYTDDTALGCSGKLLPSSGLLSASQEVSCKVIEPHRVRSANYFTNADKAGRHGPAMLTFPVLYDKDGTALTRDPSRPTTLNLPKLLGPLLAAPHQEDAFPLLATVLSSTASPNNGLSSDPNEGAELNWVAFDLRAPRAHSTQAWNVIYEGALPWFTGRRGRLQCAAETKSAVECELGDDPSHLDLYDSSVGFCDGGAQGADMAPAGDILEIIDDMPDPADPYWNTAAVTGVCSRADCEEVFGTLAAPRVLDDRGEPIGRDIVIEKSYQARLSLRKTVASKLDGTLNPDGTAGTKIVPLACCFPYPVAYNIRAGHQWIVTGQATGFAHRLIPDPASAVPEGQACIESCDPNLALRNGRLLARSPSDPVRTYDDVENPQDQKDRNTLFQNAQLRFVVWDMEGTTCAKPPCSGRVRDRFFSFQEVGGFVPMRFGLAATPVMPQSVRYVRGLQMLAIPDPVGQGLMLFDLDRLTTTLALY